MQFDLYKNDIPNGVNLVGDIAIDTEAMGLNILRDRLCLVQIADETGKIILIQLDGLNYSAPNLCKLLMDESRVKIFHFARFDVAILMHYLKLDHIPNIFCTKIASKFTRTYTDAHGLKALTKELLDIEIEKESQISFWGSQNLTQKQLKYAASDVVNLHKMMKILMERLQKFNRYKIAKETFEYLNTVCKMDILGFNAEEILNHK